MMERRRVKLVHGMVRRKRSLKEARLSYELRRIVELEAKLEEAKQCLERMWVLKAQLVQAELASLTSAGKLEEEAALSRE
mmetsp:Transcript_3328/g.10155  ORF Transcript_3328/g.10155 Transcript_3328/m.10155 type:complete len:80 (+) Transcript_3328:168-407(+)